MNPLENFDRANLIGGAIAAAVVAVIICLVVSVLPLLQKRRAERAAAAETAQAIARARADDLERHDPTIRENRPYPRKTPS